MWKAVISIDFLVPPLIGSFFPGRLAVLGLQGQEGLVPPWEMSVLLATEGCHTLGPYSYVSESCGSVETQPQEGGTHAANKCGRPAAQCQRWTKDWTGPGGEPQ